MNPSDHNPSHTPIPVPADVQELFDTADEATTTYGITFTPTSVRLVDTAKEDQVVREVAWADAGKFHDELVRHYFPHLNK